MVASTDVSGASALMGDIAGVAKGEVLGSPFFSGVEVTIAVATSLDFGVLSSLEAEEFSKFDDDRCTTGCASAFLIASDNFRFNTNLVIPSVSPKFCSSSVCSCLPSTFDDLIFSLYNNVLLVTSATKRFSRLTLTRRC